MGAGDEVRLLLRRDEQKLKVGRGKGLLQLMAEKWFLEREIE